MAEESTKKSESAKGARAGDESVHVQEQVLEAIKRSQDATIQIVTAWSESVARLAPQLPEMPKLPLADALPKPGEVSDQLFDFAQKLLTSQQEFVAKLMKALPGSDKTGA
jgi:3-methyladenine DNA glycosylase AlkC